MRRFQGFRYDPIVIGDAVTIMGFARGGNDQVSSVGRGSATALGDALTLGGHAEGGNDVVEADAVYGLATAFGDAETITDHARGGGDIVTGSSFRAQAILYGDAETLSGFARGGKDTLIAQSGTGTGGPTLMYGDGANLLDHSKGGDDTLIGGNGNEQMWGDAAIVAPTAQTGADKFVFAPPNGHDTVNDFETGKDHIELDGYGFGNFNDIASKIQYTTDGALIIFDANDSILVVGVNHLSASDFILT